MGVPVALAALGLVAGEWIGGWWGGFLAGAMIVLGLAFPVYVLIMVTGSAQRSMGSSAEKQVSEEIHRGLAKEAHSFDRISFKTWDVDHLVVSRARALIVETKWSAEPWDLDSPDDRLLKAAHQATRSRRSVGHFLGSPQIALPLEVGAVVVLCGRIRASAMGTRSIDGCPVVSVRELRGWIASWCLSGGDSVIDTESLEAGCRNLATYLEARDEFDAAAKPEPFFVLHGVLAPAEALWEGISAFLAGVILPALLCFVLRSELWIALGLAALMSVAVGITLLWVNRRAALFGWLAGGALLAVSLAVAVLRAV
ncbi:hypothetical protein [Aquihabitans sp. McL0605]|uniref:hypothetical protein n=1 Tax=Aquihabitans sp. McL0605 TaxID=3415671 RepID=UPI003CE8C6B8